MPPKDHQVTLGRKHYSRQQEILEWCRDNFGERDYHYYKMKKGSWLQTEAFGHQTFTFSTKVDATFFALRWASEK